MTPDKIADAIERIGTRAHIVVEGNHGQWNVAIIWGGAGAFQGCGATIEVAYRMAYDKAIHAMQANPGLHNLIATAAVGVLGLPATCHGCDEWQRWEAGRMMESKRCSVTIENVA